MSQNFLERLQLQDEKNLLIQGLPSSVEKQFVKLAFAKNLTPLLKMRKIDFALIFVVNELQLRSIIKEVLPALREDAKLWVAYPKAASKIATTLNRGCTWECLVCAGYQGVSHIALDHVWTALRFIKTEEMDAGALEEPEMTEAVETLEMEPAMESVYANGENAVGYADAGRKILPLNPPADFAKQLKRSKVAAHFFDTLSHTHKKEYLTWINAAKKEETRSRRLESAIDKLIAGKKNPRTN